MAKTLCDEWIQERYGAIGAGQRTEIADTEEPGLRLRIGPKGVTWSLLARDASGKKLRTSLGVWPAIGASQARILARQARMTTATRPASVPRSVIEVLGEYFDDRLVSLRTGNTILATLETCFQDMFDRPIDSIRPREINAIVRTLAENAPSEARRNFAHIKTMFGWAADQKFIRVNPASDIRAPLRRSAAARILSLDELGDIWRAAETMNYPNRDFVRLLILIGTHPGQVLNMRLGELDLPATSTEGLWNIPGAMTRSGRPATIPLTAMARHLVEQALTWRPVQSDEPDTLVFMTSSGSRVAGGLNSKRAILRAIEWQSGVSLSAWRLDDIRLGFALHAARQGVAPPRVAARCQGNVEKSTAYARDLLYGPGGSFDRRIQALRSWEAKLERLCWS